MYRAASPGFHVSMPGNPPHLSAVFPYERFLVYLALSGVDWAPIGAV
jgi:hypothetical protein